MQFIDDESTGKSFISSDIRRILFAIDLRSAFFSTFLKPLLDEKSPDAFPLYHSFTAYFLCSLTRGVSDLLYSSNYTRREIIQFIAISEEKAAEEMKLLVVPLNLQSITFSQLFEHAEIVTQAFKDYLQTNMKAFLDDRFRLDFMKTTSSAINTEEGEGGDFQVHHAAYLLEVSSRNMLKRLFDTSIAVTVETIVLCDFPPHSSEFKCCGGGGV